MSSSAEPGRGRRVLRAAQSAELAVARVVSPHGTVVAHTRHADRIVTGPTPAERLADERRAGFAEGRLAALADANLAAEIERNETLKAVRARLEHACEQVARDRRAVVDEVVGEAVDLAFELAGVLVGDALEHLDSPARAAVRRALALAPEGEDLRVRLHPDAPLTRAELAELGATGSVSIVADASLELTGCVIEVGACRIDAQIGPALERVRAALERVRTRPDDEVLA